MGSIFKSLSITLVITCTISSLFWAIGFPFIHIAIFSFVGQLVFFYVFNTILQYSTLLKNKKLENERIAEFTKQGIDLECANCNQKNFVPIRFAEDNTFTCLKCTEANAVYINITTAQTTNPVDLRALSTTAIIREKEEALAVLEGDNDEL